MTPAFGLYTHIQSNQRRSLVLLGLLFSLVYLLAFAGVLIVTALSNEAMNNEAPLHELLKQGLRDTLSISPIVSLGLISWICIAWEFNTSFIAATVHAKGLERSDSPELYAMVENLCISRGMSVPHLSIAEESAPNAFASGVNENQYTITFTRGLIDLLTPSELEAVAAHELTHIRNGDVRMMMVAIIIAGVVSFVCELLLRIRWSKTESRLSVDSKGKSGAAAAIAFALVAVAAAWALSLMIRLALSRSREYLADAGSVELTKNPDAMISALRKIEGKGELEGAPSGVMEMCIDNPRSGFADLFSTHPSIEDRIEALTRFAGGRQELA